jgi:hypothetical protein
MAKDERIAVRLDTTAKAALAKAAEADGRSISSMVERIVAEWLRARVVCDIHVNDILPDIHEACAAKDAEISQLRRALDVAVGRLDHIDAAAVKLELENGR